MLALKRMIGPPLEKLRTPMLVPSFSSKSGVGYEGPVDVDPLGEVISSAVLISAYDLHFKLAKLPNYADTIFVDSGGYEALKDVDAAAAGDQSIPADRTWTEERYQASLAGIAARAPFVAVSYDHPNEPLSLPEQLQRAERLFPTRPELVQEFLIKPEPLETYVDAKTIIAQINRLVTFPILGVTDKELGGTMMERLICVARIRKALSAVGAQNPIHVFGSLDPLTSPLYFLAGADIFDGLAWLKYGFSGGRTVYRQNFEVVELDLHQRAEGGRRAMWYKNYLSLVNLEDQMKRFLKGHDFSHFGANAEILEKAWGNLDESLGD
jgi:hypothetical protein